MDKIFNHKELAVDFIVPYLRIFDGIAKLAETNGERWQDIENCIWYILTNQNVDVAPAFWLDLLGIKAGQTRSIYAIDDTLFQFDNATLGFDAGLLLSGTRTDGTKYISLNDEIYRSYIKFAMVRNNYNPTREELITAIKILTSATKVLVQKVDTLTMSLIIKASVPEDYKLSWIELINSIIPQCIELDSIYQEHPTLGFQLDSSIYGLDYGLMDDYIENI